MHDFAAPLQRLIDEFRRLPGIGQKSAQRLAFHVLRSPREHAAGLAAALIDVKDNLGFCALCNNISDGEICSYCRDPHRDPASICVVEEPHNILPIETTRSFSGIYHVLHGSISPLRGIGPEQLRIKGLLDRIGQGEAKEIILATNPTVEGEATAVYLSRLLRPLGVKVTRIAMGIPVGSDLEFADEVTMLKSLENRREM
jgi:recombination protein RecR